MLDALYKVYKRVRSLFKRKTKAVKALPRRQKGHGKIVSFRHVVKK